MPVTDKDIVSVSAGKVRGLWHPSPWGRTLYVNSAHLRSSDVGPDGLGKDHPLNTLARAIALAQAGDMIIVGPGHTETVSTATALDVNVADVQILGVGQGLRKPKFTMDTVVGSTFTVSASGVRLENLHFAPGIDAVSVLVTVTGDDVDIVDCYLSDTAGYQPVIGISVANDADNCRILGLRADDANSLGAECIAIGTGRFCEIRGCHISGDYSAACIKNITAAEQVLIADNYLENLNAIDVCIDMAATGTGRIARNCCRIATDAQTSWISGGDCDLYENYGVNVDAETGVLIGTPSG